LSEDEKQKSETKLAIAVIIVSLLIAGAPLFIINVFSDNDRPEDPVNAFFDNIGSRNYDAAVDETMDHFSDEGTKASMTDIISELMDTDYISFSIVHLTRMTGSEGINVTGVEARISDMESEYNVTIDDWSALKMEMTETQVMEHRSISVTVYSLQYVIDGKWYFDLSSLASSPRLWTEYAFDPAVPNVSIGSFMQTSGSEYKLVLKSTQDAINITSLAIYVTRLDEPIYNDTTFSFAENVNGSKSTASPWQESCGESMRMRQDAFTYVDADMNGLIDDGDYLLLSFEEDVTGAMYGFDLYYGSLSMNGGIWTMGVNMPEA